MDITSTCFCVAGKTESSVGYHRTEDCSGNTVHLHLPDIGMLDAKKKDVGKIKTLQEPVPVKLPRSSLILKRALDSDKQTTTQEEDCPLSCSCSGFTCSGFCIRGKSVKWNLYSIFFFYTEVWVP